MRCKMPAMPAAQAPAAPAIDASDEPAVRKPNKKICCACPESKKARDECIVLNGEEACKQFIEAHKVCLRKEGFNV